MARGTQHNEVSGAISLESEGLRVELRVRVCPSAASRVLVDEERDESASTVRDLVATALSATLPALHLARDQFETSLAQALCKLLQAEIAHSRPAKRRRPRGRGA